MYSSERLFLLVMMMSWMMMRVVDASSPPPHIIFILADDLGWGDVSYNGGSVPTPNIDDLGRAGTVLHRYYGDWLCTPSRAALMTARYAIRHGLQHSVILAGERSALPLNNTLLPQYLKGLGYATHMVGKWHLGYHRRAHMPTERGFDSFFGYGNGCIDYYDYTNANDGRPRNATQQPVFHGTDLFNGTEPVCSPRREYATRVFTQRALDIIRAHDARKQPLFLYLSHLAVHGSAGGGNVVQAPPEYVARFPHIPDRNRRVFAGMVSALDDSVGEVVSALGARGMLGDSVVVFASDNGGETAEEVGGYASNAPLRGQKQTLWEGGVRVPALVFSPRLQGERLYQGLMHVSDWLPTLYSAAGGDPRDLRGPLDGVDQWGSLQRGLPFPRDHILHNSDPLTGEAAFRRGHWKLVKGGSRGEEAPRATAPSFSSWWGGSRVRRALAQAGLWTLRMGGEEAWREQNAVRCSGPPPPGGEGCDPSLKPCLFNVTEDPCEQNDLADRYPEEVSSMLSAISAFEAVAMAPQSKPRDPLGDPACHNFAYVPWLEPEYFNPGACFAFHH